MNNKIIVIPAYNEAANIVKVVNDIKKNCKGYDYIIINDGSTDNTLEICRKNKFNVVNLIANLGFSGAVQTGYLYASNNGYDIAIQFDGDGQHDAAYVPELVSQIGEYDYVIGSRFIEQKKPWTGRMIGARIISVCIFLRSCKWFNDPTSGMRAVNKKVLDQFARNLDFIAEPDTVAYYEINKYKIKEVQVEMHDREEGVSHFRSIWPTLRYMLKITISILFLIKKSDIKKL